MFRKLITGVALLAVTGCGKGKDQASAQDSLQRDLQLAPADSQTALNDAPTNPPSAPAAPPAAPKPAAPKPAPPPAPRPVALTADSGTLVSLTGNDSLHSRHDEAGKTMYHATVAADVKDAKGRVVIPAGSVVTYRLAVLEPAKNKSDPDGSIRLEATEVSINGETYAIKGVSGTQTVEHKLVGQGVTAGGAARVGGGAAAGAIAGKIIGGKTGAIVGGVVGAAGGTAAAIQTADRDVVVVPGAKVTLRLDANFTITK
jgi:hypothetical protein